ncbi:hypothetical protein VTH06DRAFT_5035, partial [Thermothelomyces fergusii]
MGRSNPDEIDLAEDDHDGGSRPHDDDNDEEDAAVAATMGFTSFGGDGARPAKKRRVSPRLDEAGGITHGDDGGGGGARHGPGIPLRGWGGAGR